MPDISLAEAKSRLSEIVTRVAAGDSVRITRRGRPVAQMSPVRDVREPIDAEALRRLTDGMPRQSETADQLVRRMRDEDRY